MTAEIKEPIAKLTTLAHAAYKLSGAAAVIYLGAPDVHLTSDFLAPFREDIERVQDLYAECGFERGGMKVADERIEEVLKECRQVEERAMQKEHSAQEADVEPLPLSQLQQIAHRAFDAGQEKLARCLFFLVEACMEMRIEEVCGLMQSYRNGEIALRDEETGQVIRGGNRTVTPEEVLGYEP